MRFVPFAGEALSFGDLGGRHLLRNVGVHEFAHLVDKSDGIIDGVPGVGLDRQAVGPWLDLVRRKMVEIEEGKSDINRYALTNQAEFLLSPRSTSSSDPGSCNENIRNCTKCSSVYSIKIYAHVDQHCGGS